MCPILSLLSALLNTQVLKQTLAPCGLPVYATVYEGRGKDFIVFVMADEHPDMCGDDEQITEICYPDIHYFSRGDPEGMKKYLRALLRKAGFIITGTTELYEKDTRYHHVIISAEIDGEIDDEGGMADGI